MKKNKGCIQKKRETKVLFSTFHQRVRAKHFQGSRIEYVQQVLLITNTLIIQLTSLCSFSQLLLLTRCRIEYPFAQLGAPVLVVSPPETLTTPALLERGECWETALVLYQHCSAVTEHWCIVNIFSAENTKHSAERAIGKVNSIPSWPHTPIFLK